MASGMEKRSYKPGEIVDPPGIYRVIHERHRSPHEVTLFLHDAFPKCRICGGAVRFELRLSADAGVTILKN
jgi:hypothetical protein